MTSILFSNLMHDILTYYSKDNFVMKASLDYISQIIKLKNNIKNNKYDNIKDITLDYKNASISIKMLSKLFKNEIKNYPNDIKDDKDFDKLIMTYLNENFDKICPNINIYNYYTKLNTIFNSYKNKMSFEMLSALELRTLKIIKDLYDENNYEAIKRFLSFLENQQDYIKQNIIYIVYFGLFFGNDTNENRIENYKNDNNETIINKILNNRSNLPDSIIKHICSDKQFKDCDVNLLILLFKSIFMYFGNMGYENYSLMIQKILNNNIENLDSEASFLDLKPLYNMYYDYFHNKESNYEIEDILSDIKSDALVFYETDDMEDNYGNIK